MSLNHQKPHLISPSSSVSLMSWSISSTPSPCQFFFQQTSRMQQHVIIKTSLFNRDQNHYNLKKNPQHDEHSDNVTYTISDRFRLPSPHSPHSPPPPPSTPSRPTDYRNKNDQDLKSPVDYKPPKLCQDQKGFLSHLSPKSLFISTIRIGIIQASQILTSYFTDQLAFETELDEQLLNGQISSAELDYCLQNWEQEEWSRRWWGKDKDTVASTGQTTTERKGFLPKLYKGLQKFHILVLTMRSYEFLFGFIVKREAMDALTKDSFKYAIVAANKSNSKSKDGKKIHKQADFYNTNMSTQIHHPHDNNGESKSYGREMFETCIYSNIIAFLSDFTIQQTILCYAYYTFIKNQNMKRRHHLIDNDENVMPSSCVEDDLVLFPGPGANENVNNNDNNQDNEGTMTSTKNNDYSGGILLSFLYKSSQLFLTKSFGLFVAGIGGSIGSMARPGWGTLLGIALGDACTGLLLDN